MFGPGGTEDRFFQRTAEPTRTSSCSYLRMANTLMYVHGWQTAEPSADYTLESWDVPLVSGGSLAIDSAPTAATLATVGTTFISWSGLATGTEYLGAVSHNEGPSLLGLTLISVDTELETAKHPTNHKRGALRSAPLVAFNVPPTRRRSRRR